jgi:hypothetical protein
MKNITMAIAMPVFAPVDNSSRCALGDVETRIPEASDMGAVIVPLGAIDTVVKVVTLGSVTASGSPMTETTGVYRGTDDVVVGIEQGVIAVAGKVETDKAVVLVSEPFP